MTIRVIFLLVFIFESCTSEFKEGDPCVTPNQERATCIQLLECDVIYTAISKGGFEGLQFFQESLCGSAKGLVCCGSLAYHKHKTTPLPQEKEIILSSFSDKTVCGLDAHSNRIKGGKIAEFEEFPWLAALEYESKLDNTNAGIRCGGSVISDRYVLTAAHCIHHVEFVVIKAWLGVTNIGSEGNCLNVTGTLQCVNSIQKLNVEKASIHPLYRSADGYNDVGLLRLENTITFTNYIRPICLPSLFSPSPRIGNRMMVAGWGRTENHVASNIKLKVDLPVQNASVCNAFLKRDDKKLSSLQLCVGGERGKDSCQGDSGGPLMKDFINANGEVQWYQEGLVSYGLGCGAEGRPGIYIRIGEYVGWIVSKIFGIDLDLKEGESCATPSHENATCVPLKDCDKIVPAIGIFDGYRFFQEHCSSIIGLVCCESSPAPKNISSSLPHEKKRVLSTFSNEKVCGLDALSYTIQGGRLTQFEEFPWLAALEYKSKLGNLNAGIRCSGSVINNRYVLTAAHCIVDVEFEIIKVWLGVTNIGSDGNCLNVTGTLQCVNSTQKLNVEKAIPHPDYHSGHGYNDIGLLRLESRIQFTNYIRPICLPSPESPSLKIGDRMTVAGWGDTENHRKSDIKLKMDLPVQIDSICNEGREKKVSSNQLCVGGEEIQDSYHGNSGEPLMKDFINANGKIQWYQEGIASDSVGCGIEGRPSVYTRVSAYISWIVSKVNKLKIDLEPGDSCKTPDGNPGTCVVLSTCPMVFNAASTKNVSAQEFAKKSSCGFDNEQLVCCESPASLIVPTFPIKALPDGTVCGVMREEPRIFGGVTADIGELPWMVGIEYRHTDGENEGLLCTGSLINNRYVLTSAYCLISVELIPIRVWLGEWKLSTDPDCNEFIANIECADSIKKVPIKETIPHVFYNTGTRFNNNIGLILLESEIEFTDYISPICLPFPKLPSPDLGLRMTVAGWGLTENGNSSDVLLKVTVPLVSSEECQEKLNLLKRIVSPQHLCAGGERIKDTCKGDYGGPLMRSYDDTSSGRMHWYQEGVVSHGFACGLAGYPSVYTRVSSHMHWIINIISED